MTSATLAALAGLSKHETAKAGNIAGMTGMAIALAATITLALRTTERGVPVTALLIAVPMAIGAVIGFWRAKTVEMTGMPELVAILHSFVVGQHSTWAARDVVGTAHRGIVDHGRPEGVITCRHQAASPPRLR